MKIPKLRVTYTAPGGSPVTIPEVFAVATNYGIDAIKDTFQFSYIDKENTYSIDVNGRVKIYLYYLGETETLVMDGLVTEVINYGQEKRNTFIVKGNNILEILLNHQVRADYVTTSASGIIHNLILSANDGQPSDRQITWYTGNDSTSYLVNYFSTFRPVFQHIESVSTDQYTGNGPYIFYLDSSNNFHWHARPSAIAGTIDYGTGTLSMQRTKNPDDIVNFMIVNAGKDLSGNSIHTYAVNPTSVGQLGWRTAYEVREDYANYGRMLYSTSSLYLTDGSQVTSNTQFRQFIKESAEVATADLLERQADGRNKMQIQIPGSNALSIGQQYQITFPHAGWPSTAPYNLRLTEYSHNFDKGGWITELSLQEDIK